jgi:hypothetical protein
MQPTARIPERILQQRTIFSFLFSFSVLVVLGAFAFKKKHVDLPFQITIEPFLTI